MGFLLVAETNPIRIGKENPLVLTWSKLVGFVGEHNILMVFA